MDPTTTPLSKARLATLLKLKQHRRGPEILLEGPHLVLEAKAAGLLREVLVPTATAALEWREKVGEIPITVCRAADFERIAEVRTPQDVLAVGEAPRAHPVAHLLDQTPAVVYCDGVQDPGNVGTIIRTGIGLAGAGFVFGPKTADRFSPKVIRASQGALLKARFSAVESHEELARALAGRPHRLVILDAHEGLDFRAVARPDQYVLVAGNEGAGSTIQDDPRRAIRVRIPLDPRVESLNVASAVAVVLARWA